ncbi:MAG: lytic transglycosylase domain-containing protein [Alphaproteobacteria bacterium]|nr:lytic transglycosylase domain-containing protein [Alphaproteobacteria bacterium]
MVPRPGPAIAVCLLAAGLGLGGAGPARAYLPTEFPEAQGGLLSSADWKLYRRAFAALAKRKWGAARRLGAQASDPLPAKVIAWSYLAERGARAPFAEIAAFIDGNPEWPSQRALQRNAEAAMDERLPDADVLAWFADHAPVSGLGRVRLAEALMGAGQPEDGLAWLRNAWIRDDFARGDERRLYKRHRKLLIRADHEARLDRLLWDGRRGTARRMLRRVSNEFRLLAEARLRLMARAGGVDPAIARVPAELKDHPGLVYERLRWRRRKGFDASARELLLEPPDNLIRPHAWWVERAIQVRHALDEGAVTEAYRLAQEHKQSEGADFAEAEWLAGWIALRFLDEDRVAYGHFARLYEAVRFPISRARGAYWAGRSAESMGESKLAQQWYALGAAHPTAFYGQLAALKLADGPALALDPDPSPGPEAVEAFNARELVRAVRLLAELGEKERLRPFIMGLNELAETPAEHALVALLAKSAGRADLAVASTKRSVRAGVVLAGAGYPIIGLPAGGASEPALVLAVARQESEFNPKAVSNRDARGLMQLLPATAKVMSRQLKLRYDKNKLTEDPWYNARLGSAFLAELIERHDGSYVLALAAYNAGPSRVKRWLKAYGDPRTGEVDALDWIELVPFAETRNYLHRVLEGLQVYRHRIGGARMALTLEEDLARNGGAN